MGFCMLLVKSEEPTRSAPPSYIGFQIRFDRPQALQGTHVVCHMNPVVTTSSNEASTSKSLLNIRNINDWSSLFYIGGASLLGLHFVALPFVAPAFRKYCLPYVAANEIQLRMLTNSLRKYQAKRVVDLGSGDGVVCIHIARELGIPTVGYELNPWLVAFSKLRAQYSGVGDLCSFHRRDLFSANITSEDGIILFVVPSMMDALEAKLEQEMKQSSRVYALRFPLNTWKSEHYEAGTPTGGYNVNQLWVYRNPRDHT
jgi:hypothetical protein